MADIVLINQSTLITAADIAAALPSMQRQIDGDFAPAWGVIGKLWNSTGPAGAWKFYLQDGLDQPGDLGYHEDETGAPEARIDIQGSASSGNDWRTVVGHEILETLADPLANRMAPDGSTVVEVCDPCESTLYLIDGVPVTNFCLPAYFGFDSGTKYDFNGQLTGPSPTLLPGGYLMQYLGGQWISHFGRMADGSLSWLATRASGRSTWRASKAP